MQPLIAFVLILGFCLLLIFGLLSVLQGLLDRNFLPDPWMTDAAADADHSMDLSGARRG